MKKYKIIILVCIFTLLGIFIGKVTKTSNIYEENENYQMKKHVDAISMMLETEAGSGNYELTTRDSWPTEGYVFNESLSKCENGGELSWDDANKTVLMSGNISDKCYVYFDKITLSKYVIAQYNGVQGNSNIYYHDVSLENGAGDNSYRYAGSSETTNNYVCFGSRAETCPEDNLYRIIGVFDWQVKLIKATAATSTLLGTDGCYATDTDFKWSNLDACPSETTAYIKNENILRLVNRNVIAGALPGIVGDGCHQWIYSDLNVVNLNTNYLKNIGTTWSNMIEDTAWKVSGHTTGDVTAKNMYTAEITNATKTYGPSDGTSKIGLIYASDYGFAAAPSAWTTTLYNYDSSTVTEVNWMYIGIDEWTLTPLSSYSAMEFGLKNGSIFHYGTSYGFIVRPVFYLKTSVVYARGSGTASDPIRIEI